MQWAPHTLTLATLARVVVEVELPAMPSCAQLEVEFPADCDVVAKMMPAAAIKLGVHCAEIHLVDGKVVLHHPSVNVTVTLSTRQANNDEDAAAGSSAGSNGVSEAAATATTAPMEMKLPIELGPTAQETAPATVPASAAVLSVEGGADLADLEATLEATGIVDGAALVVRFPPWSQAEAAAAQLEGLRGRIRAVEEQLWEQEHEDELDMLDDFDDLNSGPRPPRQ